MESRFFMEAKVFSFFSRGRQTKILCERRRGFLGSVLLGPGDVDWLIGMMEELLRSSVSVDFVKSIRMESKALTVRRGGNRNGQFLVVSTQVVDNRKNVIVLPKGCEGRERGRFARELSKIKAFFKPRQCPFPTPVLFLGAPRPPRWCARLLSITCVSWT